MALKSSFAVFMRGFFAGCYLGRVNWYYWLLRHLILSQDNVVALVNCEISRQAGTCTGVYFQSTRKLLNITWQVWQSC